VHDPVGVQVQQTRHNLQWTVKHWLQNGLKSPPVLRYRTCKIFFLYIFHI
jgi:hypothetical protein